MLKIVHLSDLHFSHISYSFKQLLSKQWIGNLNAFFHRKRIYQPHLLRNLALWLQRQQVKHVIITGDLVTTALPVEFEKAVSFLQQICGQSISVHLVPGNHDKYTTAAEKQQLFEKYFHSFYPATLQKTETGHFLAAAELDADWWWVGLDAAVSTPLFCSWGLFVPQMEQLLDSLLSKLQKKHVILSCHYPLIDRQRPRRVLKRSESLQQLLKKHDNVKIYLHGHTHQRKITNMQHHNLPIIIDAGSCSHVHKSSLYLLTLESTQCHVQLYTANLLSKNMQWQAKDSFSIPLKSTTKGSEVFVPQ